MSNLCDEYIGSVGLGMALQTAGTVRGQTFPGNDEELEYVNLYIDQNTSGNTVVKARIYEVDTGTYGVDAYATGAYIAESTNSLNTNTIGDVGSGVGATRFDFPAGTVLDSTKKYVVCAYVVTSATANWGRLWCNYYGGGQNTAHPGNGTQGSSGYLTSGDQNRDFKFQVYTVPNTHGISTRSAKITGKATTNSTRSAKITGKETSNSTRSAKITGVVGDVFSKGLSGSLPGNDANLTIYTATEIDNVSSDNDVYAELVVSGSGYSIHQYKKLHDNNTDKFDITVKLKSSTAPTSSPVYLQVYNRNSASWETLDTESAAAKNTEFTLTGQVNTNLSNYYDANKIISIRVYQELT